jgi:hypothetical protein
MSTSTSTGRIVWDKTGERFYETGVDQGVLFPKDTNGNYAAGVPWNGLINVNQAPSGAEANPLYADNVKYLNLIANEEFGAGIECYTYPDEFGVCLGEVEPVPGVSVGQQPRREFGFSYRTLIGNDVDGQYHGYKIHLVYNAAAAPSEKGYGTVNETPEAMTLSYDITTTPVKITGLKPAAHLELNSKKLSPAALAKIEEIIYGKDAIPAATGGGEEVPAVAPRLPLPDEVISIIRTASAT